MAAYVVVHARKKNDGKYDEYAAVAGPSILANGGNRCPWSGESFAGQYKRMMVIAKFPNKEDAENGTILRNINQSSPLVRKLWIRFFSWGGLTTRGLDANSLIYKRFSFHLP